MRVKLNVIMIQMSGSRSSTNGNVVGVLAEPKQNLDGGDGFEVYLTLKYSIVTSFKAFPKLYFLSMFCDILGL